MALYFNLPSITPTTGGGGGSSVNVTGLDITPSTSAQSFVATGGVDGYSPVNVSAVTASIDANITAGNIASGVNILGVIGTAEKSDAAARYNVVNGVAEPRDSLTGAFDMITSMEKNAFNNAFVYTTITGSTLFPSCISFSNDAMAFAFYQSSINGVVGINNCTYAGKNSFRSSYYNTGITSVNASRLTNAADGAFVNAFENCSNLTSLDFSNCLSVGQNAFSYAFSRSGVISCDFPRLYELNLQSFDGAFRFCQNLVSANFTNLKSIATQSYAFRNTFANSSIQNVNMYQLYTAGVMGGSQASTGVFENCFKGSNLTSIVFDNLSNVSGNSSFQDTFANCNSLIYAHFPKLKSIYKTTASAKNTPFNAFRNAFLGCTNLNSVKMPMLSEITGMVGAFGNAFRGCSNLLYMEFPALQNIGASSFWTAFGDSGIKNIIFPQLATAANNSFSSLLASTNDCVVHFPANMESTINTWPDYANNFDGTNATILFDCYPVSSYYPITENGTMGGDTFAVNASIDSTNAYLAFDGDANTGWQIASTDTPADYVIYTPKAVELTSINVQSIDNNAPTFVNISGSNDGTNWSPMEIIVSTTGANVSGRLAYFTDPAYYKYYKVVCGAPAGGTMVTINSMDLVGHYIG